MSCVLGISAGYHDAAAALILDGQLIAAMQEERFTRIKNDSSIPSQAVSACLAQAGLTPAAIDRVVFYENPFAKLERVLLSLVRSFPQSWKQFPTAISSQIGSKIWILDQISSTLNIPRNRIFTTTHHRSHAASAFFPSPFDEAAILTVDGIGEEVSTGMWLGKNGCINCIKSIEYPHSLGLLYAALTAYLGFEVNEGEYKVMGLAAYGTPCFKEEFASLISLSSDGSFELNLPYFAFHTKTDIGFSAKMEKLFGPRRHPGKHWDFESSSQDRKYANIAATLQWYTEEVLLGLARNIRQLTGCDNLCLAGGVALNCVANARLLKESGFSRIFVQPAAGDAGGALGAAILASIDLDGKYPSPLNSCALGENISNDAALKLVQNLGINHTKPDDIFSSAAELIANNKVVAFAHGRFEWGPRALGQRSMLAAPQDKATRERLNKVIKKREPFRPFAPAILSHRAGEWFEGQDCDMSPFMTSVANVRPERAKDLGACTHIDGTARVQTVSELSSPGLFNVLHALDKKTGIPIVVNTSLNGNGEPIVGSALDAISFFVSHPVDAMVVGDILLKRNTL